MTTDAPRWPIIGALVVVGHLGAFVLVQNVVPETPAAMLGETNVITAMVSVEDGSRPKEIVKTEATSPAKSEIADPKVNEATLVDPPVSPQDTVPKATEDKAVKVQKAEPKVATKLEPRSQPQVTPKPIASQLVKKASVSTQATNLKTSSIEESGRGVKLGTASAEPNAKAFVGPSASADYLNNPHPKYPKVSLRRKETGTVWLTLTVTAEGLAKNVRVKETSGYVRLDEAALEAVKGWRFRPARRFGQPVDAEYELPIHFKLKK